MKRAPTIFPSSQNLQPIPTFVHANISGNVNSSSTPSHFVVPVNVQNNTSTPPSPPSSNSQSSFGLAWILLIVAILLALFFIFFKRNKEIDLDSI